MKPFSSSRSQIQIKMLATIAALVTIGHCLVAQAVLVQPYNYMLDESALLGPNSQPQHEASSLAALYNENQNERDIVAIIGESLARMRFARMMNDQAAAQQDNDQAEPNMGHLSQEMAELLQREQAEQEQADKQQQQQEAGSGQFQAVANMVSSVAKAASDLSAATSGARDSAETDAETSGSAQALQAQSSSSGAAASTPSKADLKNTGGLGSSQWFNPKEVIPMLKISSMATPSRYKKVYFRSEKKLVDGAFHSASSEHPQETEKKSLIKSFGSSASSSVQRRSSRGTSSSVAPPGILQDGVIDFLKKFRDVYIQTRPVNAAAGSASSVLAAAASSPLASVLAPSTSGLGSRPNLASAISAATSMVNSAASLAQAASNAASSSSANSPSLAQAASPSASSSTSGSGSSAGGAASGGASVGSSLAAGSILTGGTSPIRSPLTAQSYVSFWSKTFPTWVRKMLKQMRRRSLQNHNKRKQSQHHHSHSSIGQKVAHNAVQSAIDSSTNNGSSSSSSANTSSS